MSKHRKRIGEVTEFEPSTDAHWWQALIPVATSLIGAAAGRSGTSSSNRLARYESQLNRDFQERMSNTAVSRRMQDMRAAGINPLLASRYDASTPAGSMAAIGDLGKSITSGMSAGAQVGQTAVMAARANEEMRNLEARTGLIKEQTEVVELTAQLAGKAGEGLDEIIGYLEGDFGSDLYRFLDKIPESMRAMTETVMTELRGAIDDQVEFNKGWQRSMSQEFQNAWDALKMELEAIFGTTFRRYESESQTHYRNRPTVEGPNR